MQWWQEPTALLESVPVTAWVAAVAGNLVVTAATWSLARRRVRRAGERIANPNLVTGAVRARDTALTVAALVPAALFLVMVLAGSMHGLVAFGHDVLLWQQGWEYLVPGTLDGVSIAFAFLAFRAIRRRKAPDRCYRVVWGAAGASAAINFSYEFERSNNVLAGGYLGLLSVLGMVMFHEFLSQFEDGTAYIKRENPKFGLRWLTWPTNTLLAAIAWRNHPPVEGTVGTVTNAVVNLERVRQQKRDRRRAQVDTPTSSTALVASRTDYATSPVPALNRTAAAVVRVKASSGTGPRRGGGPREHGITTRMRVPTTEATLIQWLGNWVRMCADEELWSRPLTDDQRSRTIYGLSARQLRRLRQAALSGALRRQADQMGVSLPPGYVDHPDPT